MLSGIASINWNVWPPLLSFLFNLLLALVAESRPCPATRSADLQLCVCGRCCKEGHCWTLFPFGREFSSWSNAANTACFSLHRLRSPASEVTCHLSKELAGNKSWFTLLNRLSEAVRCMGRLLRTLAIFLLLQTLLFWLQVKGNLSLVCPGDCDLKTCWPALLIVYTMFEIFLRGDTCSSFLNALQTNLTDMFQEDSF